MPSKPVKIRENRLHDALRSIQFTRQFTEHAEGSVLAEFGKTRVICTASIEARVPPFLKDKGQGWITAEYGMLPRSTHDRMQREAARGKQSGRTQEIQRLIGRSLRAAVDLKKLGEFTITLDCDVIQADGGTRTAAITGACIALHDAITFLQQAGKITSTPFRQLVASVSVGMHQGEPILDLNYAEDSTADTDMNVVMTEHGEFIEIQGTAENGTFGPEALQRMLQLAQKGIGELITLQRQCLQSKITY